MGQSAEELRREIEDTRGDLSATLDAIGDRVSPGRMIDRRKTRMTNSWYSMRDRVMGSAYDTTGTIGDAASGAVDTIKSTPDTVRQQAQGNPLAAGAIAFGVGVLAASIFKPTERERQATDQLMEKVEPVKEQLVQAGQEMAEHMKEPAREAVEQVKGVATEGKQAVTETAKDVADTSKETARQAADSVRSEATGGESYPQP